VADKKPRESKEITRFAVLVADTWGKYEDFGEVIGSVGWLPRELSPLLRPLMYCSPHCISHYAFLAPWTLANRHPSIYFSLIIWGLSGEDEDVARGMCQEFDTVYTRTNLKRWANTEMHPAWVMLPGVDSDLTMNDGQQEHQSKGPN